MKIAKVKIIGHEQLDEVSFDETDTSLSSSSIRSMIE